jgi:hypothetical protein
VEIKNSGAMMNERHLVKAKIKKLRDWAREHLQQELIYHDDFGKKIRFTGRGIKEYLNQPHKYFSEKNELIKDINSVIKKSVYKGYAPAHNNINAVSHIFETEIGGDKSWLIIREYQNGDTVFYSVSDSENVLKDIKK